jgi:tRNA 2-thiocytidine biosynthesis protein TtcA
MGYIRKADQDFHMITEGDHVAVGLSGGKDSVTLCYALALYRKFSPHPFTLSAVHLTMGFGKEDTGALEAFCREIEVPLHVRQTQIGPIIFEERKEKNPCALCAKMRRGVLHETSKKLGATKVALGHHRDDAMETLLLSIFQEGRMHVFSPISYLSRTDITMIRPMVYVPERHIANLAKKMGFPVAKSPCPIDGKTRRQDMKELLVLLDHHIPDGKKRLFAALRRREEYCLWDDASITRPPRGK